MRSIEPSELIGKMVKDEWGRRIGMVVSVLMDDRGETSWLLLQMGDGEFRRYALANFSIDGSDIVLLSGIKRRVNALCRKEALLKCEKLLLSDLKEGDIDPATLNEIGRDVKRDIGFLEGEARRLLKKVEFLIEKCKEQIRLVNKGIACLKVEHDMGKISDEVFSAYMKILISGLKSLMSERDDMEEAREKLLELLGKRPSAPLEAEIEEKRTPELVKPSDEAEESPIDIEVEEGSEVVLQA